MYLKLYRQDLPCLVLSLGGFVLKFALQHQAKCQWYSALCRLLHLMYFDPWVWQVKVVYSQFFSLENSWTHVSSTDYSNIATNVEVSVYQSFNFCTILGISDVNPDDHHVRFGWSFDNVGFGSETYVIEDMSSFDDIFNYARSNRDISVFNEIWNIQNLEIRFWLRKLRWHDIYRIYNVNIFNILLDSTV